MNDDLNISTGKGTKEEQLRRLKEAMTSFDSILIGAGSGLSKKRIHAQGGGAG